MREGGHGFSLLPLLEGGRGSFRLRFTLASKDIDSNEPTSFPFLLISDSDPVARIVAARVESPCGERIASLFLVVQKDDYRVDPESFHPVTNPEVEGAWQRAEAAYRRFDDPSRPRFFREWAGVEGGSSTFAPLFHCREKGGYFHPPCPRCGRSLDLCDDDAVLAAAGLPLYSGSLRRHLYCRSCSAHQGGIFYAVDVGSGAPPLLRDRISLVRDLGNMGAAPSPETGFPCSACEDREECFGPSLKSLGRIVPFSFYPFHAFAFDAMSLCAPDFLALLSGAGADTLAKRLDSAGERGRARLVRAAGEASPLLFDRGERKFLEILYLKLAFLADLAGAVPAGEKLTGPLGAHPSVDRAWVTLGPARGHLPRYWNFRTDVLEIGRFAGADASGTVSHASPDLLFLGVAWFEALLVNAKQDGRVLRSALSERLRNRAQANDATSFGARDPGSPFHAGNLFFEPAPDPLSEGSADLWDGVLAAGWSILRAGVGGGNGSGWESIRAEIRSLASRVRDRLFGDVTPIAPSRTMVRPATAGPPAEASPPPPATGADEADAAVAGILDAILRKWTTDAPVQETFPAAQPKPEPARPRPAAPPSDDFMVKTVVLGDPHAAARPPGTPSIAADALPTSRGPAEIPSPRTEETIEKTMILRPLRSPDGTSASPDESIEKTVILRAGTTAPPPMNGPAPPVAPSPADDFLDRTVILGPGKSGIVPPAPAKTNAPVPPAADEPVDLEKTVIIKAPKDAGTLRRHGR